MDLGDPDATDAGPERNRWLVLASAFGVLATLGCIDLVGDLEYGTTVTHVLVEGLLILVGALGLGFGLHRYVRMRRAGELAERRAEDLSRRLSASQEAAARWQREAQTWLTGLGVLIDQQFERWGLTSAEGDVARLLLKGLSHKEIATIRAVGEATVRQQATAIYRKSGLGGRHDLSAFFLEDLLTPRAPEGEGIVPGTTSPQ